MTTLKTLPARNGKKSRNGPSKPPEESDIPLSETAQAVLRLFNNKPAPDGRPRYNVKKALAALRRMSGCVSHGSLAQNIDDELYGPMR